MKNLFFFSFFLLFSSINMFAQLRTEEDALHVAESFLVERNIPSLKGDNTDESASLKLVYAPSMVDQTMPLTRKVYYYIYNLGDNQGFVIVSGDERAKKILGYSEEGCFDINNISDNLKYWLSFYEEELDFLTTCPAEESVLSPSVETEVALRNQHFAKSVAPMVQARWNQDTPYNYDCPVIPNTTERSMVGCTAIASAQIMHYHQWPKTGKGSLTYKIFDKNVTVKFSDTTYDWSNMANIYSSSASKNDVSVKAVSQFLYHVSFSAKTNYGRESGAYTRDMAIALRDYFGYDEKIQVYLRDYFTKSEWEDLIKTELNASRPVHYAGFSNTLTSGHAFVCDGYDENGLFHFNWGWGGSSNGYFELSALSPGNLGIGSGSGNYNRMQEIITGIQPPDGKKIANYQIYLNDISCLNAETITRNANVRIRANKLFNYGINAFAGQIALCLFDDKGTEKIFAAKTIANLNPGTGWNELEFSGTVPSDLSVGKYKVYFVYKDNTSGEWTKLRGKSGVVNHYNVDVTTSNIIFSEPTDRMPELELEKTVNTETQSVYKDHLGKIKICLKNTGGGEYNSFIAVAFDDAGKDILVEKIPIVLAAGETKEFLITGTVKKEAGTYGLYVLYDPTNGFSNNLEGILNKDAPVMIEVKDVTVSKISLALSQIISFPDKNKVTPNTFDLQVKIKNNGDYFDNRVYAAIENTSGSYTAFDSQYVFLEKGEEAILHFTNPPGIKYGTGKIGVFYSNPLTGYTEWFTPSSYCFVTFKYQEDDYTGIEIPTQEITPEFTVYPNPATDILFITADKRIKSIHIYDSAGRKVLDDNKLDISGKASVLVNHLNPGLYMLQLETEEGLKVMKFQKK